MEFPDILRVFNSVFRQKAHHLAPCHFSKSSLLLYLSVYQLPEFNGDEFILRHDILFNAPGVFSGSQIDNHPVPFCQTFIQAVPPEII